jgi:subtilase family serine protease
LTPGTYYIGGIADYNNQVSESNETDNTYNVTQITVTGPSPSLPNLSEQVFLSSTTLAAGASTTVDSFVVNYGSAPSAASTARIYLSTDPTITTSDTLLATVNSGTLAAVGQTGYYDHQTLSVTLPANLAPGTYYIGGIADYNNQISESNETDNTYNVTQITVTAAGSVTAALTSQVSGSGGGSPGSGAGGHNFVFAANFGKEAITGNPPSLDHTQFDHGFTSAAPDSGWAHAFVGAEAGSTLPPHEPMLDMLHHHLSGFHIV